MFEDLRQATSSSCFVLPFFVVFCHPAHSMRIAFKSDWITCKKQRPPVQRSLHQTSLFCRPLCDVLPSCTLGLYVICAPPLDPRWIRTRPHRVHLIHYVVDLAACSVGCRLGALRRHSTCWVAIGLSRPRSRSPRLHGVTMHGAMAYYKSKCLHPWLSRSNNRLAESKVCSKWPMSCDPCNCRSRRPQTYTARVGFSNHHNKHFLRS